MGLREGKSHQKVSSEEYKHIVVINECFINSPYQMIRLLASGQTTNKIGRCVNKYLF